MKLFTCDYCGQLLYFENTRCEQCGHTLGYLSDEDDMITLTAAGNNVFANIVDTVRKYKFCSNISYDACNWLLTSESEEQFCVACKLNNTIPNLANPELVQHWRKLEIAKHRLVYTLLQLDLPVVAKKERGESGLSFDFLAEEDATEKVVMGHSHGLITINVAEADEANRTKTQQELGEPYRTLLGHFRHESGHYYWDKLIASDEKRLENFRKMFGDERENYTEALKRYYKHGALSNWASNFVSAYSAAHPWEDWAETWAHYLHIMDTLETAYAVGLRVKPGAMSNEIKPVTQFNEDPFQVQTFQQLIDLWIPLTVAVNSLNRSMGQPDFYPFVTPSVVVEKLDFIHQLCKEVRYVAAPAFVAT